MNWTRDRLVAIDVLRGVAVLAVVVAHLPFSLGLLPVRPEEVVTAAALPESIVAVTRFGQFGVHLFLVISGFCIHLRWVRMGDARRDVDFVAFWRRRLVRLYPPYLAALFATVLGLWVVFGVLSGAQSLSGMFGYRTLSELATDLFVLVFLLQNVTDASYRIGNPPLWTLALEEQLYLLYFPLLAIRRRVGWGASLFVVSVVALLWRAIPLYVSGVPFPWLLLGPARWVEWALGALAVEAHLGRVRLPVWCSSLPLGAALLFVAVLANLRGLSTAYPHVTLVNDAVFGLAFFVLVNFICGLERSGRLSSGRMVRALAGIGLFSYSLYLTQVPAMVAAKQVALRLGLVPGGVQTLVIIAFRFVVALGIAYAFYRLVEVRAIRASRRLDRPQQPAPAGTAQNESGSSAAPSTLNGGAAASM